MINSEYNFLATRDIDITNEYLNNGYYVGRVEDKKSLESIRKYFIEIVKEELNIKDGGKDGQILDLIHEKIPVSELNDFRMKVIQKINKIPSFRQEYYKISKRYLDIIVGNEIAMQVKVNLSIQFPGDSSSLLPIHADTWSGDSPFEVVVWIPLVDCFETKSMYILNPEENSKLEENFKIMAGRQSEDLYKSVQEKVEWIKVDYGEVLLFNNALPHGNRINLENETRWSMNCRFKGVFSPYWDKEIGSFFEPITLRAASITGMNYKLPKLS